MTIFVDHTGRRNATAEPFQLGGVGVLHLQEGILFFLILDGLGDILGGTKCFSGFGELLVVPLVVHVFLVVHQHGAEVPVEVCVATLGYGERRGARASGVAFVGVFTAVQEVEGADVHHELALVDRVFHGIVAGDGQFRAVGAREVFVEVYCGRLSGCGGAFQRHSVIGKGFSEGNVLLLPLCCDVVRTTATTM